MRLALKVDSMCELNEDQNQSSFFTITVFTFFIGQGANGGCYTKTVKRTPINNREFAHVLSAKLCMSMVNRPTVKRTPINNREFAHVLSAKLCMSNSQHARIQDSAVVNCGRL